MSVTSPHYLLLSEARHAANQDNAWRFVLENVNSLQRLTAADVEPQAGGERLELLAVVRGLEALDCPARVTLITKSRYVNRGLKYGMSEWREKNWQWERFGKLVPVRDRDLWQRVDRAMQFHQVQCRAWQFASDTVHDTEAPCQKHTTTNCVAPSSGKKHRITSTKRIHQRIDPCHSSPSITHPSVDSRTQPKRPPASKKVPTRKSLQQKKDLNRRSPDVVTRMKWTLYAWLSRLLSNVLLTDTLLSDSRLSEHQLQPLS